MTDLNKNALDIYYFKSSAQPVLENLVLRIKD
jgi:hypothetical protein